MSSGTTMRIVAVGDVSFCDHPVCVGFGVASTVAARGADWLFNDVAELVRSSDEAICNLEGVVSLEGLQRWRLTSVEMRGHPSALASLRRAGFSLIGVANNHVMQHGLSAFDDMLTGIRKNGMDVLGVDSSPSRTLAVVRRKFDTDFHFLGFSMHPEEHYPRTPPYSLRRDSEAVLDEVRRYRATYAGPMVVSIHWGREFLDYPSPWQVALGRALIDSGVSVVLGHHSHVLQHVERRGTGVIFYSLGNFVFDLWQWETTLSVLADMEIDAAGRVEYQCVPVVIGSGYRPEIAGHPDRERIMEIAGRSEAALEGSQDRLTDAEYDRRYRARRRHLRPAMYRHFVRNLYRSPPHLAAQALLRTAWRRLSGQ